ncbi:hypothetical protein AB1Y20_022191 [Prymnesium parvum]|uniref:Centrosomal protein of 162 kDa n=1 Tax=Prymnesium parvum TaxID=97485 RepID=A0AB34JH83_PRYPA
MPKEVRLHQAWVTHHGERSVSPPRPSTEPACKGSPRADTLDSGQYQRRALGGADPQVMAPVESPAKVLQRILRLPARTKRVGGGYRDVPYSSDDLLRSAVAALLALQPELKSEQQARLQAEAALAEERTRMDKAVLDSEHMARQSAMSAHEIAQLQDKVKRLEEGRQVVGELKAERQARMQAEARLGDERVKLELAVQERDKLAEQVNSVKREVAELRDQVSKLDNAKHLEGELRARMETGLLSQYKQKVQELSMTLEAETERRSLLERRLESGSKAAITLVKSIPRVRSTSPRGSPLSITVSIANEGSTSDDAVRQAALAIADGKWDTWLEIALERIHACAHRIDSDAEAIEELQRQLMREEARFSSALEAQLTEQVSVKAELQAQIVAEQEKRQSLEQSAHELQAELIRSTRELASLRLQTLEAEIMSNNVSPMGSAERNSATPDGSPTALQSSAERGSSPRRREVAASIFNEQLAEEATRRYTSLLKDKAEADAERRQEQEEHKAEAEAQMARVTIDQLNRLQE